MSDIRVSMREFRFLEEKRKLAALSQAEEQRWIELGQMLGIFEVNAHPPAPVEAQQPQGYYADDGNWYPYAGSTDSFPPQPYPQSADGAVGADAYDSANSEMSELLHFADPPPSFESASYAPPAPASDEVMEVDPNDVFLVEHGESAPQVADHPGPAAQADAPSASPEHSAADGDGTAQDATGQSEASLQLTQSYEWIPASPAPENAVPLEAETPDVASQLLEPALAAGERVAGSDPPESSEASIPLTKNFEWIPESPTPESSVPLNEGWSDAPAGDAMENLQPSADAHPQAPDEALSSESPVIDLLESDAMQAEVQQSSWEDQIPQDAMNTPAIALGDAPVAEPLEVEPIAQWTREAEEASAGFEQPEPGPAEAAQPNAAEWADQSIAAEGVDEPNAAEGVAELNQSFGGESSSALPPSEVSSSSSAPSSFQFVPSMNFEPPEQATPAETRAIAPENEIAPQAIDAPSLPPLNGGGVQQSEGQDSPSANMPAVWGSGASQPAEVKPQFGDGKELLSSSFVQGDRRVVIHLLDGQVKRGSLRDVDLMASHIPLHSSTGTLDNIPIDRIKAIFFMVAPGAQKPVPQGQKVRLTFQDGREVIGFSTDYKTADHGFFVTPADTRSNTERIFVLRWSILTIDER